MIIQSSYNPAFKMILFSVAVREKMWGEERARKTRKK